MIGVVLNKKPHAIPVGKCCSRVGIGSLTYNPALKSARHYSFVRSYNFYNTSEKLFVKRFGDIGTCAYLRTGHLSRF
jgi:hypothetical protein